MEDAYFSAFTEAEGCWPTRRSPRRAQDQGGAAAEGRVRTDRNAAEVVVAATDRPRLFVDLAGAITGAGANVVGARCSPRGPAQALDVFYVQDVNASPTAPTTPARSPG